MSSISARKLQHEFFYLINRLITGQNAFDLREVSTITLVDQTFIGHLPKVLCHLSSSEINRFMKQRISDEKFCSDFTKLWLRNRDIIYKHQEVWHEPYDQQLLEQWQSGKLTEQGFQHQWLDL